MWEINLVSQIISFLYAVLVGIILSVFFDFFRALRKVKLYGKTAIFFQDIAFWIIATLITFLLLIARCNGEVRGYILIGELLGFFGYRITLSKFVLWFLLFFIKCHIRIFNIYKRNLDRFADFLSLVFRKIGNILLKKVKKVNFKRKNS